MTAAAASIGGPGPHCADPVTAARQRYLWAGLGTSLALHFALLHWSAAPRIRPAEAPGQRMRMTLLPPTAPVLPPPSPPRAAAVPETKRLPRGMPAAAAAPRIVDDGLRPEIRQAEPEVIAPRPSIDLDQAHREARDAARKHPDSILQREPADAELARRLQPDRQSSEEAAAQSRSLAARFARRLQRTPTGETRMTDGTIVMRFSDNVCVVVPPSRPSWQGIEETLITPSTCPN